MSSDPDRNPALEPAEPLAPDRKWTAAVAGLLVVFVALAGYDLVSGGVTSAGRPSAPRAPAQAAPGPTTAAPAQSASPVGGSASSIISSPAPSAISGTAPGTVAVSLLTIASAAAYGPDGTSDGDHAALAPGIINGGDGQAWRTSWYATPEFGNLQSGTGLLLDMGQTVSIRSLRLVLGAPVGADVQVRVGNMPLLSEMPVAATASDVGGTVQLRAATSASGEYVLIWFTQLPPNAQGKYQVSVSSATVYGTYRT